MPTASPWKDDFTITEGVTYLNHGSFGPAPRVVQETRERFSRRLESQPMNFFLREMEWELEQAAETLARFVGTESRNLVFVDNATVGMNTIAASVKLQAGDEILFTDQEYGSVVRIWRRICQQTGAKIVIQKLPFPLTTPENLVEQFLRGISERTKLIVISHVTSPTAIIFPLEEICAAARQRGILTCVDGPHAPAMVPVNLRKIDPDYYTASCHKWLSAPLGSGFLYVKPRHQQQIEPVALSWGRSVGALAPRWQDEFNWIGTRDPAPFLSIPAAIHYLEAIGLETFREYTHQLAQQARQQFEELTGLPAWFPEEPQWYGSMVAVPLPPFTWESKHPAERDPLQNALWEQFRIEIPLPHWNGLRLLRVSCHLYTDQKDLDRLMSALTELLPRYRDT